MGRSALAIPMVLFGLALLSGCGMFGPCTSEAPICSPQHHSSGGHHSSVVSLEKQKKELARAAAERRPERVRAFLKGARCNCADRTCGLARAARRYCGAKGPSCVDELLLSAPEPGYVQITPGEPRVLERVGALVSTNGVPRRALLNRIAVSVTDCASNPKAVTQWRVSQATSHRKLGCDDGQSILTPLSLDAGETPWTQPKKIEEPAELEADFSIAGVEYTCSDPR